MAATSYKEEHEQFVSGHSGSTFIEVCLIISVACSSCILRDVIISLLKFGNLGKLKAQGTKHLSSSVHFQLDFVILVVPSLALVTVLGNFVGTSAAVTFGMIISVGLFTLLGATESKSRAALSELISNCNLNQRKAFVTYFRSVINLLTVVCILAVDFPVFPRRFAKAETYGYGLMDTGVGFFVVSNAIVSQEARGRKAVGTNIVKIRKAIISSLPLLVLAFMRLLAVKGTDYHEHVTEYGQHWNFFFTLAALKISTTVLFCLPVMSQPLILGTVVMCLHQVWLHHGGSQYLVNGQLGKMDREGFVNANREGIFSLPGYVAIYMMGIQLGRFLFRDRQNLQDWLVATGQLLAGFVVFTVLMSVLDMSVEPVSRRFANAAYVCWIMNQSCMALTICLVADMVRTIIQHKFEVRQERNIAPQRETRSMTARNGKRQAAKTKAENKDLLHAEETASDNDVQLKATKSFCRPFCLLEAISFNALLFFLLANLLTGLVNFSISTIHASSTSAVIVMVSYLLVLNITVTFLHQNQISTKVW